jgi:predicted transcriptional regulator
VHSLVQIESGDGDYYRGRFDIIADILKASNGGVKRTYLMYRCNLSFSQLKYYSHFMLNRGLIRAVVRSEDSDPRLLEVTDKGRAFLKVYRCLKSLMT